MIINITESINIKIILIRFRRFWKSLNKYEYRVFMKLESAIS